MISASPALPQLLQYEPEDDHEEYLVKYYREELEVNCGVEVFTQGDGQGLCVDGECELGHTRNVIVGVHGAYRENNPKEARSSVGIYWGRAHPTNHGRLIQQEAHNDKRAEVVAVAHCLRFLDIFWTNLTDNDIRKSKKVIIKTDSRYVVNSMARQDGVSCWESDDWTFFGQEVQNKDVWRNVLILMRNLANNGLPVQFWHVGGEWNQEAIHLANGVLDKARDLEMSCKMEKMSLGLPAAKIPEEPEETLTDLSDLGEIYSDESTQGNETLDSCT